MTVLSFAACSCPCGLRWRSGGGRGSFVDAFGVNAAAPSFVVTPAQAGVQLSFVGESSGIPACAGMTDEACGAPAVAAVTKA